MKLTVDANVVVKWFLTEPQSDNARVLLTPRIHLHAPDILLAEYANTIWKKFHTNEIPDPQPYFTELANLPDIVTLHSGADLMNRAAQIAVELDHPVYDCLYLACAEATGSVLITADRRFAERASATNVGAWHLGGQLVADKIKAAAATLVISRDKVDELIKAYEFFAATKQHVVDELPTTSDLTVLEAADQDLFFDSPAYKHLLDLLNDLDEEERVDVLALGWLGTERPNANWPRKLEHAGDVVGTVDNHYVASYGAHWRAGYERLTRPG